MRRLWVAVLGVGLMVTGGVGLRAETAKSSHTMCRADKRAQRRTQKAEARAARNNARAAEEKVKARERKGGGQKMQSLAVVLTPPPM